MFKSNHNHGFQMTFKNGITISVQFGTGNYCERRNMTTSYRGDMDAATPIVSSYDAEIAIWYKDSDTWFNFGYDEIKGWCDTDEVATWITLCAAATSIEDLKTRAIACEMIEKI
jgi:hypothetical protein